VEHPHAIALPVEGTEADEAASPAVLGGRRFRSSKAAGPESPSPIEKMPPPRRSSSCGIFETQDR
jgi:hypothetical protein